MTGVACRLARGVRLRWGRTHDGERAD